MAIIEIQSLSFPWQTQDPFLFCVHHLDIYPKGNGAFGPDASLAGRNIGQDFTIKDGWRMYHGEKVPGFPAHPHRGFETVTIARQGFIDHSDSLGAAGRFGEGDVQWMTAGSGVQHCEMFPLLNTDGPNPAELFQIWLNLPKEKKSAEPYFSMLWSDTIPIVNIKDGPSEGSIVHVIAGNFNGVQAPKPNPNSWAADPKNLVSIWTIAVPSGGKFELPISDKKVNRTLYYYEGQEIIAEGKTVKPGHLIRLKADEQFIFQNGSSESKFLLLQGVPINEPVVQYGPFVMNTQEEIQQTFADFRRTQFGGWPWPSYEHVHKEATGRFAKYPDGSVVTP
jgi:quercetin 2,3-dioxygenase